MKLSARAVSNAPISCRRIEPTLVTDEGYYAKADRLYQVEADRAFTATADRDYTVER